MTTTSVLDPLRRLAEPVNSASHWLHLYEPGDLEDPEGRHGARPVLVLVDRPLGFAPFGAGHPDGLTS